MVENKDKAQSELNDKTIVQQQNSTAINDTPKFKLEVYDGISLIPDLTIKREAFVSKGKNLWKYMVVGSLNGRTVSMDLDADGFYLSGTRYTDKEIYDLLDFVFETFPHLYFGVKSYLEKSKRERYFFVVGKSDDGVYSPVPVGFGGRGSSLAKLSTLFSAISVRYGVTLPGIF